MTEQNAYASLQRQSKLDPNQLLSLVNESKPFDQKNNSKLNRSDAVLEEDEVQLTSLSFNEYTDEDEFNKIQTPA